MAYTHNWNHQFIQNTSQIAKKSINFCLEIGSFEGLTSNYIVENLLSENGKLFCVDPLTNVYLNENLTETDIKNNETIYKYFNNQYDRFLENTKNNSGKINLIRKPSSEAYPALLEKFKESFDLIYIDGDHRASAVYLDAVNCFQLCKKGGIILFDDYSWGKEIYNSEATSYGVDKFTQEYHDKIEITLKDYQLAIYKK